MRLANRPALILMLAGFSLMGILLMHEIPAIWHAKFYLDGQTLFAAEPVLGVGAGSYRGSAWIFGPVFQSLAYMGVDISSYSTKFNADWFIVNLFWALPYLIAVWVVSIRSSLQVDLNGTFLIFCCVVLYAPFYGNLNKDIVPMMFSFLSVFLILGQRPRAALVLFGLSCVLYGLFVRLYFLPFVSIVFGALLLSRRPSGFWLSMVAGVGLLCLAFPYIPRTLIDIGRSEYLDGVSATRIGYAFDDLSRSGFVLNRLMSFFRICFPVELTFKSPAYIPFIIFRCYVSLLAFRQIHAECSFEARISACIVIAFSVIQAVFEPDFGSAFRHLVMIMPFVVLLRATASRTLTGIRFPRLVIR